MIKTIIAVAAALTLVSCASNHAKVEYPSGQVESVGNPIHIGDSGDTVIVKHYVSLDSIYGSYFSDKIWGYYKGTIPNESVVDRGNRISRTWYEIAVIK